MSLSTAKNAALSILIAGGVLLGGSLTFAASQFDETTRTTSTSEFIQYLSTASASDFQQTLQRVTWSLTVNNTSTLTVQIAPLASCSDSSGLDTTTQNLIFTNQTPIETGVQKHYTFTRSATSTIAGKCYGMRLQQVSGTKPYVWGSTSAGSYSFGVLKDAPGGGTTASTPVVDAYFHFLDLADITILSPTDGSTQPTTFGTAKISYYISSSTQYSGSGTLAYGYASSSLNHFDFFAIDTDAGYHTTDVGISDPLSTGTLYLQAYLYNSSSAVVASSTLISITLSNATNSLETLASSTVDVASYCENLTGIQQSLCNTVSNGINSILHKPPFGYVTLFKETITGLSTSTASSTYTMLAMPSGSFGDFFTTLRNGLVMLLWLLLLVWGIIKFGNVRF